MYYKQLARLAKAGHPVFNLEYPLAPEHPHPQVLLSLLKALAWIHDNYPHYKSVHLVGDSAGGNLAMMLGILIMNPSLRTILGSEIAVDVPKPQSIISMYGVLDRLSWLDEKFPGAALFLRCYAGEPAFAPKVSSQYAITPMDLSFDTLPPVFLAVGAADKLVPSSCIFAERLEAESRVIEHKVYPGASHGFFTWGTGSRELLDDVLNFFSRH